ncbi:MAG: hypothetical protein JSR48_00885 [Verrucomicrobia bacterium]|nr:hypothetical protein [Verrucomicrobiota bacterium]
MNPRRCILLALLGLASAVVVTAKAAPTRKAPESDLATVDVRREAVEAAANMAKAENPAALPDTLPQPFSPPGFDRDTTGEKTGAAGQAAGPAKPSGDRELLAAIASKITPSGTFFFGGEHYLQFSKKRLKVGDKLTVNYEGLDCTLELTAIDATNFTLRLNREEITRPIKPGKTP